MRIRPIRVFLTGVLSALCLAGTATAQESEEVPAAPPPYVRLEYRLTIERETTTTDGVRRVKPLVPHSEKTMRVTLGPRVIEVVPEGGRRTLYDYRSGRAHEIDDEAGTYRSTPLVAHFGFLEIEMHNRRKMATVLEAAGAGDLASAPVERSILFGWPDSEDDADIATAVEGDATVWRLGDDELTRWTPSEHALDAAQSATLARFMALHCRIHWEVREAIVAVGRAPRQLRYRWFNTGERAVAEWTLVSCERRDTAPAGVEALTRDFPDTDLGRLARRVLQPGDGRPPRLSHDDLVKLSNQARDADRPRDAAMLLLESNLQEGADVTTQMRALLSDAAASAAIRALMGSITRANHEPKEAVAELDAVDRSTLTHPALIDVFRANGLANMGRQGDAEKAFLSALDKLPWLSAAYADLGWGMHGAFRTGDAWLAWEVGRAAGPDHPTWEAVRGLEEHLLDRYGELL